MSIALIALLACAPKWKMVWHEEFNRGSVPDPKDWVYEKGYVRNHEPQFYTDARPENCRIEGGNLVIEARKDGWEGHDITSASITTQDKHEFLYGRIEVRAKLPTGKGTWPAIWTLGNDHKSGWPNCGEIDIMENVGFNPDEIHWTVHTNKPGTRTHIGKGEHGPIEKPYEKFHVYALEWSKDKLDFFVDKQLKFSFVRAEHPEMEWEFDKPHYLLLNLAIGGSWGGQKGIDDSIFPAKYFIDYVRVYQQTSR